MYSYDITKDLMNINEASFSPFGHAHEISNHYLRPTNKDNLIWFVEFFFSLKDGLSFSYRIEHPYD